MRILARIVGVVLFIIGFLVMLLGIAVFIAGLFRFGGQAVTPGMPFGTQPGVAISYGFGIAGGVIIFIEGWVLMGLAAIMYLVADIAHYTQMTEQAIRQTALSPSQIQHQE